MNERSSGRRSARERWSVIESGAASEWSTSDIERERRGVAHITRPSLNIREISATLPHPSTRLNTLGALYHTRTRIRHYLPYTGVCNVAAASSISTMH